MGQGLTACALYGNFQPAKTAAMQLDSRLEIRLPSATRNALDALAADTGLTSADLVRIALRWLLTNEKAVLQIPRHGEDQ
jgi:Ribbon-helix-helix protein, copG family